MSAEEKRTPRKSSAGKKTAPPAKSVTGKSPAKKSPAGTFARPDPVKRIAAGLVDGIPAYLIAFIPFLGGLISATYLAVRDGLPTGDGQTQSLGKRLLGLKTIRLPEGKPCDYLTSLLRNLPFAVPALIMVRPVKGWILGSFIWGALFLIEILLIIVDDDGARVGDRLAGTTVVEVSEKKS